MFETPSMIECYRLDVPVAPLPYEAYIPTQSEIDEVNGFDAYEMFMHGTIDAPEQPTNAAYMAGWLKHEKDWFFYDNFRDY